MLEIPNFLFKNVMKMFTWIDHGNNLRLIWPHDTLYWSAVGLVFGHHWRRRGEDPSQNYVTEMFHPLFHCLKSFWIKFYPVGNSSISHQIFSKTTLIAFLNFKLPHFQSLTNIDPCSHYGKISNSSLLLPVTVRDRTGGGDMVYSQAYSVTIWLSIYFGFKRQSCWEISQSFPSKNLNKKLVAGNRPRALKKNQYFNV